MNMRAVNRFFYFFCICFISRIDKPVIFFDKAILVFFILIPPLLVADQQFSSVQLLLLKAFKYQSATIHPKADARSVSGMTAKSLCYALTLLMCKKL